ncbi:MAG: hypothetical protein ABH986_03740 [archaeon]
MPVGIVKQNVMFTERMELLDKKIRDLQNEQINLNVRLSSLENKKH